MQGAVLAVFFLNFSSKQKKRNNSDQGKIIVGIMEELRKYKPAPLYFLE